MLGSSLIRVLCAGLTRAGSSSKEISHSIAFRARARYMAPLSRFTYPSLRARRDAMVLLPAPAGPSMAMMSFRAVVAVIPENNDCTRCEWGCFFGQADSPQTPADFSGMPIQRSPEGPLTIARHFSGGWG